MENFATILDHLRTEHDFKQIIVWSNAETHDNCEAIEKLRLKHGLLVISCGQNIGVLGRFIAARLARTDYVYTQDDDCLVYGVSNIIQVARQTQSVACYLDEGHMRWAENRYTRTRGGVSISDSLLGYGSAFPTSAVNVLKLYTQRHGVDEFLRRKADRLFCLLQAKPHANVLNAHKNLPGCRDKTALWRRPDHWRLNEVSYERAFDLLVK